MNRYQSYRRAQTLRLILAILGLALALKSCLAGASISSDRDNSSSPREDSTSGWWSGSGDSGDSGWGSGSDDDYDSDSGGGWDWGSDDDSGWDDGGGDWDFGGGGDSGSWDSDGGDSGSW